MSILKPTALSGTIEALLVNTDAADLATSKQNSVEVSFAGFDGDNHTSLTRASCTRVKQQYVPGTEIRNTRQISILSTDEMGNIAKAMGLPVLQPEWVGANLLLAGIPDLSALPPSTRLIFEGGVSLVVDMENESCRFPGDIIENHHAGFKHKFAAAAKHLRGVTAWVEKPGQLNLSERCVLHIPKTRTYSHIDFSE